MNKHWYDVLIGVVIVFLIVIAAFIVINWNPSRATKTIPFGLSYPDLPGLSTDQTGLWISMMIRYNGTLTENNPILAMSSTCQIISPRYKNVWSVSMGFPQAIPWSFKDEFREGGMFIGGIAGASFTNMNESNVMHARDETFYFPVSGDFSPALEIIFFNGTRTIYTYDEMKLHVASESEVNAESMNRNNLILTIAITGFSFIEGGMIIKDLIERRSNTNQPKAINNNTPKTKIQTPNPNKPKANLEPKKDA